MAADDETGEPTDARISVEASSIDGIVNALGFELVEEEPEEERDPSEYPEELLAVLETLAEIYGGVETATEQDERGRSRKMVRQFAEREDLDSDEVGHLLRVLEAHDLVVQDGNRWRIAEQNDG